MSLDEIPELLRELPFIPETRILDNLFREIQSKCVEDEYGQTVHCHYGLRGNCSNIMDQYDVEENFITKEASGSFFNEWHDT